MKRLFRQHAILLCVAAALAGCGEQMPSGPATVLAEDVGIRTTRGDTPLIRQGTYLPATFSEEFGNASFGNDVGIVLWAGNTGATYRVLADFPFDSLTPAGPGVHRFKITLKIDATGRASVQVIYDGSGRVKEADLGLVIVQAP